MGVAQSRKLDRRATTGCTQNGKPCDWWFQNCCSNFCKASWPRGSGYLCAPGIARRRSTSPTRGDVLPVRLGGLWPPGSGYESSANLTIGPTPAPDVPVAQDLQTPGSPP